MTEWTLGGDSLRSGGQVMFSTAEASFGAALAELRDEFGSRLAVRRLGPDLGMIAEPAPTVGEVAEACRTVPLTFLRHLAVELVRVPVADAAKVEAVVEAAVSVAERAPELLGPGTGDGISLQVWASGRPETGYGPGELFNRVAAGLVESGHVVSRADAERVLSCCLSPVGVSIGLNTMRDSLSGWAGGRVRLARREPLVSRAEFKLEELFQAVRLDLPERGKAVDLGASPGGWTRILRQRGLTVWAVDPGELDERVATDPGVHHVRTTAGNFLRRNDVRFDLAVNDIRMDPTLSCEVMLDVASSLRPGALAIMTLKIGKRRPVEEVRHCLALLDRRYRIVFARQLHHNRQEVTVVARRPPRA